MNVLSIGIDDITVHMLRAANITVEVCNCDYDDFDIQDWSDQSLYALLLINLDAVGGQYVCRPLRKAMNNIPVIGISLREDGRTFSELRAMFLENGGDDLLPNPLNTRELMASIRAVLRRVYAGVASDIYALENSGHRIDVDLSRNLVLINGHRPVFAATCERLLVMFASKPNRVVSKDQILSYLYSDRPNDIPEMKIVDVFICKLRNSIDDIVPGLAHNLIRTEWGRGYYLDAAVWKDKKDKENEPQVTDAVSV